MSSFLTKRKKAKVKRKKLPSLKLSFDLDTMDNPIPSKHAYN